MRIEMTYYLIRRRKIYNKVNRYEKQEEERKTLKMVTFKTWGDKTKNTYLLFIHKYLEVTFPERKHLIKAVLL